MYKVPKGTKDLVEGEYEKIRDIIQRVEKEFQNMGGEPLETPVFERKDVLMGKYGDEAESKLIYNLADEGGELLALRYDLTIPFTRFVKETGCKQMRRYSIGKVYRRDQPNANAGRFREFYQADFDIYGEKQEGMLAEATLLNSICQVLKGLNLPFKILINSIPNLQFILESVLQIKDWKKCCPIIDKLDKQPFNTLVPEFQALGLTTEQIQQLDELLQSPVPLEDNTKKEYDALQQIANIFKFDTNLVFTNSLARGLDYYTGFIWEFKLDSVSSSISAGGRYDNLLSKPAVGISLGVSRLASYLPESEQIWKNIYYVTTIGNVSLQDKLKVIQKIKETVSDPVLYSLALQDKKLNKVLADCCSNFTRYVVIIGENELERNEYILKDLKEKTQELKPV